MSNTYFRFKQFTVDQDRAAMKVCTDACLFGAWVADQAQNLNNTAEILDIGTGTGLLAMMLAQKTDGSIRALEIDGAAAGQASDNVANSPWANRIAVLQKSVQEYQPENRFQLIISNPPFFDQDLVSADERKNTAKHSSQLTFDVLAEAIAGWLDSNGKAYLLIPNQRLDALLTEMAKRGLNPHGMLQVSQTPAHGHFRTMLCLGKEKATEIRNDEMFIRDESGEYSDLFRSLLKDYYLKL